MQHRIRQCRLFGISHAVQKDRHQQRGALIVSNLSAGHATNKELDFLRREFSAITFLPNNVLWSQFDISTAFPFDVPKVSANFSLQYERDVYSIATNKNPSSF